MYIPVNIFALTSTEFVYTPNSFVGKFPNPL